MARWRAVCDRPEYKIRKGQILERLQVLAAARTTGQPAHLWAIPEDLGLSWLEKEWPPLVEIEPELGPPLALEADEDVAANLAATQAQLEEAQGRRGAAEAGYQAARLNLEAVALRCRITGAGHQDKSDAGLYRHHAKQWAVKLAQAGSDVARLTIEVETLRAELEPGPRVPDKIVVLDDDGHGKTQDAAELRQELLKEAAVVQQLDGLLDRLHEAEKTRDGEIGFLWPPVAVVALQALRRHLGLWASATGRGQMELRFFRNEPDVVQLLEGAAAQVEAARQQEVNAVEVAA